MTFLDTCCLRTDNPGLIMHELGCAFATQTTRALLVMQNSGLSALLETFFPNRDQHLASR